MKARGSHFPTEVQILRPLLVNLFNITRVETERSSGVGWFRVSGPVFRPQSPILTNIEQIHPGRLAQYSTSLTGCSLPGGPLSRAVASPEGEIPV
jgi:hypothetical protein